MSDIIQLTKNEFIGAGGTRTVYRHPLRADLCIKIPHPHGAGLKSIQREQYYLSRYQKHGKDFTHIAGFHGLLETSLGTGGVYTLVRNEDGTLARTLRTFLREGGNLDEAHHGLQALKALKANLLANAVIFHDISATNLVVREARDGIRIIMIDGIGNSDYIKINDYIPYFARRKIRRKWRRILQKLPSSPVTASASARHAEGAASGDSLPTPP